MTDPSTAPIPRHLDLTDRDVELVLDVVHVLDELDDLRPDEMTPLFYAMQYENLRIVVEDLLRVLGAENAARLVRTSTTMTPVADVDLLDAWLRSQDDCVLEDGVTPAELARAETVFGIRFPPLWRQVLARVHPVGLPKPPRAQHGVLRWTAWPDWRLRDEPATRALIDAPVRGLWFDVEHNDFWWTDWGTRPDTTAARLAVATERLAEVPRLVPLRGHMYVADTDDSPVFDIVQADLYVPALTVADLATGRDQDQLPLQDWPVGAVPFWSELHAYSQLGPQGPFAHLGTGGL